LGNDKYGKASCIFCQKTIVDEIQSALSPLFYRHFSPTKKAAINTGDKIIEYID